MTRSKPRSTTDKVAIFSFTALLVTSGVRLSVDAPSPSADVPATGALIESRMTNQQSVPLAQVLATQVQIERLMAAGLIDEQGLDQAFDLLERSAYSVNDFLASKGQLNIGQASLKMVRPDADAELLQHYQDMSRLVEQYQPGQ